MCPRDPPRYKYKEVTHDRFLLGFGVANIQRLEPAAADIFFRAAADRSEEAGILLLFTQMCRQAAGT